MTDAETIEAARSLFANDTPGDKLGRRLLAIAEREHKENQELRKADSETLGIITQTRGKVAK